jgi:hypothetical protein
MEALLEVVTAPLSGSAVADALLDLRAAITLFALNGLRRGLSELEGSIQGAGQAEKLNCAKAWSVVLGGGLT